MADTKLNPIEAALAAGAATGEPKNLPSGGWYAVVPEGHKVVDLEKYMARPRVVRQTVYAETADAFIEYFAGMEIDSSMVFASILNTRLVGVVDYHSDASNALHGSHTVIYEAPHSEEWNTWTKANRQGMSQDVFAQFIEDNLPDIVAPAGADMLEMAMSLEAKSSAQFISAVRLSDGSREFTYSEDVKGTAQKGKMSIPETFTLGIPVFRGGDRYEVMARFRYRIKDGNLVIWYDLHRHIQIRDDAFGEIVSKVDAGVKAKVIEGRP